MPVIHSGPVALLGVYHGPVFTEAEAQQLRLPLDGVSPGRDGLVSVCEAGNEIFLFVGTAQPALVIPQPW